MQHITIDCNRPGPLLLFSLLYLHPSFCVGSILTHHYTGLVLHIRALGTLKFLPFFQQYLPLLTIFSCVLWHHTFLIFFLPLSKLLLPPLLTPPRLTPPLNIGVPQDSVLDFCSSISALSLGNQLYLLLDFNDCLHANDSNLYILPHLYPWVWVLYT